MNLWIPDKAGREAIGELGEDVSLGLIPHDGELPQEILDAELLVHPAGDSRLYDLLGQMPGLRVLQTLSAGVDWLLPHVPRGVKVCDAGGARDTAVAEWVLAVILASRGGFQSCVIASANTAGNRASRASSPAAPC